MNIELFRQPPAHPMAAYAALYSLLAWGATSLGMRRRRGTPRNSQWTSAAKNIDGTDIPTTCAAGVAQDAGSLTSTRVEYGTCNAGAVWGKGRCDITVASPHQRDVSNLVVPDLCSGRSMSWL